MCFFPIGINKNSFRDAFSWCLKSKSKYSHMVILQKTEKHVLKDQHVLFDPVFHIYFCAPKSPNIILTNISIHCFTPFLDTSKVTQKTKTEDTWAPHYRRVPQKPIRSLIPQRQSRREDRHVVHPLRWATVRRRDESGRGSGSEVVPPAVGCKLSKDIEYKDIQMT